MNTKQKVLEEAQRIEEDSLYSAKRHFNDGVLWSRVHTWVGTISTILAALAGASSFAKFDDHGTVAGILALIVAVLSAVTTFLNPGERAKSHHTAGNDYTALRNRARIFHQIEAHQITDEQKLTESLTKLSDKRDKINKESPQTTNCAFKKAREGIEQGEATYRVDKDKV